MITKRQYDIISFIAKYKVLNVATLCQYFSLSDKTIRNEIKDINKSLNYVLIVSNNHGITIDENNLKRFNASFDPDEIINEDDTQKLIFKFLLCKTSINYDDLADSLYISTSLLNKKINEINHFFRQFDLKLIRHKNELFLQGDILDKRKALISMITKENNNVLYSIDSFIDYFEYIDAPAILKAVEETMIEFGIRVPEHYYASLILNIFSIFSLNANTSDEDYYDLFEIGNIEIKVAKSILQKLNYPENTLLLNEISNTFIGIINHNNNYTNDKNNNISSSFVDTIKKTLHKTFEHFGLNINFEKYYFLFVNHVQLMIKRAKVENWFIGENFTIENSNMFIYDVALYFCNEISATYNVVITEEEVSLIAIHLGYVIEESFVDEKKIYIGLITGENNIIDNFLINKIQEKYDFKIIFTKIDSINQLMTKEYDLIISIKDFNELRFLPHCLITPFLTENDKNKIQKSILEIIENQSKEFFRKMFNKYFDSSLFFYDEKLSNKYEVLHFLINKLQDQHIVDETFFDQILKRERLSPTCFMNKFAIPHPFSCTAFSSKIAVLINPNGIHWGNDSTVQCVFLLAISQDEQPLLRKLFDGLALCLCNEMKLMQLSHVKTYEQLIKVMNDF